MLHRVIPVAPFISSSPHLFCTLALSTFVIPPSHPRQSGPDGFEGILLGDVIFRALVVMFDLTHPRQPVIGLAPRNPDYRLVVEGCSHVNDFKGCVEEAGPGMCWISMCWISRSSLDQ